MRFEKPEAGVALLLTIMTMLLLSAVVGALTLLTSTESLIAASFRGGREVFYSAEAMGEWSVGALTTLADEWTAVTAGLKASTFLDGLPSGLRTVADGAAVDLTALAAANPGWHLFAYGPFRDLVRSSQASPLYVVALVSQEDSSLDKVKVRAMAFGPRGGRRIVELVLFRGPRGVHVVSWSGPS
jgi:hypothetical protein